MLVGLGALAALVHLDNIAERFFPEHSGGLGACTGDPFGDLPPATSCRPTRLRSSAALQNARHAFMADLSRIALSDRP
jgi:hypothetical protein